MKTREVLKFDDKEFYYQEKNSKKRIYQTIGENPTKLEISYENGKIKSVNIIEINQDVKVKVIKIRVNSKENIEISVEYKDNEIVEIDNDLLNDMHVNYKKIYTKSGELKEERLSIISKKKQPDIILKRLLEEDSQYINKKKVVMTVNTEKLKLFETYSDQLITEFIKLNEREKPKTKEEIIEEDLIEVIMDETNVLPLEGSYVIPSDIHLYDRIYSLESSTVNHLKYINTEEGIYRLEIKLDHSKQRVKEVIFIETKPKLLTEKRKKKPETDSSSLYEKGSIIRLIPLEDGNIKGLYTSKKEDIKVENKIISKTKTNAEGLYLASEDETKSFVEITLKSGKLKVYSTSMAYIFENQENSYYIVSRSHNKFTNLLRMSPYILKAVEDKIWIKTK